MCGIAPEATGTRSSHVPIAKRRTAFTLRSVTYSVSPATARPCGVPPIWIVCTPPVCASTSAMLPDCSRETTIRPSGSATTSCGPPGSAMRRAAVGSAELTMVSACPRRSATARLSVGGTVLPTHEVGHGAKNNAESTTTVTSATTSA